MQAATQPPLVGPTSPQECTPYPHATKLRAERRRIETPSIEKSSALRFDALRIALGLALVVHFVKQLPHTPALVAQGGLFAPELSTYLTGPGLAWGVSFSELTPTHVRIWFGVALALCCAIALGWRTRLCAAALLAMCTETYWGIYPATLRDDQIACVTAAWLMLFPFGRTLQLWRLSNRESWRQHWAESSRLSIPRGTRLVFAVQLLLVEFQVLVLPTVRDGTWLPLFGWVMLIAAARLSSHRFSISLALALTLALHVGFYIETEMLLASVALFCAFAFVLTVNGSIAISPTPKVGAGIALAGVLSLVQTLCATSSAFHWQRPFFVTSRILADLGMAPPASVLLGTRGATAQIHRLSPESTIPETPPDTLRDRAVLAVASAPESERMTRLRSTVAGRYANAYCSRHPHFDGSAQLVALDRQRELPLAWFACLRSRPSDVVLLRPNGAN